MMYNHTIGYWNLTDNLGWGNTTVATNNICVICKREFKASRRTIKSCSKTCNAESKRRQLSKPKVDKVIKLKVCLYCNEPRESGSSFCSRVCHRAWDNRRKTKVWQNLPKSDLKCSNCGSSFQHKDVRKNSCSHQCAYALRAAMNMRLYGTENPSNISLMRRMNCTTYSEFEEKYPDYHKMYARVYASIRRGKESRHKALKLLDTSDIFSNFKDRCFSCKSTNNLELDHHIPLALGGELTTDNCVILCRSCNARKHAKPPEEVYSITQLIQLNTLIKQQPLTRVYSPMELHREYLKFLTKDGGYSSTPAQNRITTMFNPHFYEVENLLWRDLDVQEELLANRFKYIPEKVLDEKALLRGFKISGIHKGYSHHSPFWIKQFIKDYNIKSIYDPCGGWGHRLLGSGTIPYIYNDIDSRSSKGAIDMIEFLDIPDKVVHNQDATKFTPEEDYEAVFTCPPYYNLEEYTSTGSKCYTDKSYNQWLNEFWGCLIKSSIKSTTKYFCFITNTKYLPDMLDKCLEFNLKLINTIDVGRTINSHLNRRAQSKEHLLILKVL